MLLEHTDWGFKLQHMMIPKSALWGAQLTGSIFSFQQSAWMLITVGVTNLWAPPRSVRVFRRPLKMVGGYR